MEPFEIFSKIKGRKIETNIVVPANKYGVTDILKLQQMINNLLHNALKHSNPNSLVRMDVRVTDSSLSVEIATYGVFISADKMASIFEPYHTFDETKSGMGLGLYICKLYVELLGGWIEVLSNEEGIATFEIRIPIGQA